MMIFYGCALQRDVNTLDNRQALIEKAKKQQFFNNPNRILFIDEIHNIIGAGTNQGTMDAANILKPPSQVTT